MTCLVDRILDGDRNAVTIFYKQYSPSVLRYLRKRVPEEDAQELLNEVFLDMIDEMPVLEKHDRLLCFLFRIAHHKTVDYYRRKKLNAVLFSQISFLKSIAVDMNQPDFQYEKNAFRDKIEQTFHRLSRKYRKILRMHYEDNVSIKEIAPVFNLSYKATESLLFRARRSFRKMYERI